MIENAEFLHVLSENKVKYEEVIKLNPKPKIVHALLKQAIDIII